MPVNIVNERTVEIAAQYLLLIVNKGCYALLDEFAYHAGPHIHNLFVVVGESHLINGAHDIIPTLLREELKQQIYSILILQYL